MSLTGVPQEHRPGAEPAALTVRQLGLTDSRNATPLVQNLSFALHPGRVTGLVGESGSGKSLTARALLGLLPATIRQQGEILLGDVPTSAWNNAQWRQRRGRDVAMIFQDPLQALNPLRRVGSQMAEVWWRLQPSSRDRLARRGRRHCHEQLCQALLRVHLEQPETVLRSYPHQLSGGMRQRVMIAMALLGQPKVLLADEPTAALDGQSRGSVLQELQRASALSRCAVLLISHDLSVVEHCCDELLILYGGVLVEQGVGRELLTQAAHPYTRALVGARPRLGANADPTVHAGHLPTIHGQLQAEHRRLQACVFAPRCPQAQPRCQQQRPQLQALAGRGEGAAPSPLIACHYPLLPATDFSAGESE